MELGGKGLEGRGMGNQRKRLDSHTDTHTRTHTHAHTHTHTHSHTDTHTFAHRHTHTHMLKLLSGFYLPIARTTRGV